MNLVVLAGGLSPERDVSLSTGAMAANALLSRGHRPVLLDLFYGVTEPLPARVADVFLRAEKLPARPVPRVAPDLAAVRANRASGFSPAIGNGVIELGEDCDGSAVHGRTCADVNAALAGPLACGAGCRFDTRSCVPNECEEDARQCRGTVLQYCSQNVWKDVQDCADGGLVCDPQAMACAAK